MQLLRTPVSLESPRALEISQDSIKMWRASCKDAMYTWQQFNGLMAECLLSPWLSSDCHFNLQVSPVRPLTKHANEHCFFTAGKMLTAPVFSTKLHVENVNSMESTVGLLRKDQILIIYKWPSWCCGWQTMSLIGKFAVKKKPYSIQEVLSPV